MTHPECSGASSDHLATCAFKTFDPYKMGILFQLVSFIQQRDRYSTWDCSLSVRLDPAFYTSVRRNYAQTAHVQTELSSLCELSNHRASGEERVAGD